MSPASDLVIHPDTLSCRASLLTGGHEFEPVLCGYLYIYLFLTIVTTGQS